MHVVDTYDIMAQSHEVCYVFLVDLIGRLHTFRPGLTPLATKVRNKYHENVPLFSFPSVYLAFWTCEM